VTKLPLEPNHGFAADFAPGTSEAGLGRTGTHVIVIGNEKGGSGKSTTSFHLAIYLLYQGYKVASIDVDSRQQTFTNYVKNRRNWAQARDKVEALALRVIADRLENGEPVPSEARQLFAA
jgi:cellulose biosynthesis protein BcsQ